MKKIILIFCALLFSLSVFSQQIFKEESFVINVEVTARVFKGGMFVDDLTINDFQVFEDGIPQKIEAVYLVKKRTIERSEEKKKFIPQTSRNFFLFFEISKYTARLGDAVEYLVHNVMYPGDNLNVVTPVKAYRLRNKALDTKSREEIVNELKGLLKKDVFKGSSEYNSVVRDLEELTRSLAVAFAGPGALPKTSDVSSLYATEGAQGEAPIEELLTLYEVYLSKLETLRYVDQLQLIDFAKSLKNKEGQKYVFLFYQREFIPQIEPRILNQAMTMYQDRPTIQQTISRLSGLFKRDISFDVNLVKQAYADSSISIHFLFINRPPQHSPGIRMEEHSEDIYSAFREMAYATGGFIESSTRADYLFKRAVEASENYYLLYYTPKNYQYDGKFKNINVQVKDKDYKVIHRLGYFAN